MNTRRNWQTKARRHLRGSRSGKRKSKRGDKTLGGVGDWPLEALSSPTPPLSGRTTLGRLLRQQKALRSKWSGTAACWTTS